MILGKVVGTVVTTISHPHFENRRKLVVEPLGHDDEQGNEVIALDITHAGIGDTVLVNDEGNSARDVLRQEDGCVRAVVVAIVDSVRMYE